MLIRVRTRSLTPSPWAAEPVLTPTGALRLQLWGKNLATHTPRSPGDVPFFSRNKTQKDAGAEGDVLGE